MLERINDLGTGIKLNAISARQLHKPHPLFHKPVQRSNCALISCLKSDVRARNNLSILRGWLSIANRRPTESETVRSRGRRFTGKYWSYLRQGFAPGSDRECTGPADAADDPPRPPR